ncbi:hypothetical protein WDA57_09190 [Acinetobacter nosocomialis]|uniref:hypothetical protein n=1 Tax=Acinetobacter nosocomialis TaxID=106654 RepID=UPI00374F0960
MLDWELASKFIPLITALTTISVAWFVYKVWHKQKAKEVMASEAKQCIKDLLEMIKIINFIEVGKYDDEEELKKQFAKFKILFEQTIINVMYVNDCVNILNLKNKIFEFTEAGNTLINLKSKNSLNYENPNFKDKFYGDTKLFSAKAIDLTNILRPYSVYIKTFDFRDK